jgi:hypothetical protein
VSILGELQALIKKNKAKKTKEKEDIRLIV